MLNVMNVSSDKIFNIYFPSFQWKIAALAVAEAECVISMSRDIEIRHKNCAFEQHVRDLGYLDETNIGKSYSCRCCFMKMHLFF